MLDQTFNSWLKDPAFAAVYLCLLFSVAAFVIGSAYAFQRGSFDATAFSVWVRKDGPQILVIAAILFLARGTALVDTTAIGLPANLTSGAITVFGLLQAATFVISKGSSIRDSVTGNFAAKAAKASAAAAAGDPVPTAT